MPNILVRDVEEVTLESLKKLAEENGRSLQTEVQLILRRHVDNDPLSDLEVARKIKEGLRGRKHSDSAALLREDRRR